MATKSKFLMYKGHPLVRFGNIIFYGSIADKYIIMMQILDDEAYSGKPEDVRHAKRVAIQLQLNGDDVIFSAKTERKFKKKYLNLFRNYGILINI